MLKKKIFDTFGNRWDGNEVDKGGAGSMAH